MYTDTKYTHTHTHTHTHIYIRIYNNGCWFAMLGNSQVKSKTCPSIWRAKKDQ